MRAIINDARAIICIWILQFACFIAPDDGFKKDLQSKVLDIGLRELDRSQILDGVKHDEMPKV